MLRGGGEARVAHSRASIGEDSSRRERGSERTNGMIEIESSNHRLKTLSSHLSEVRSITIDSSEAKPLERLARNGAPQSTTQSRSQTGAFDIMCKSVSSRGWAPQHAWEASTLPKIRWEVAQPPAQDRRTWKAQVGEAPSRKACKGPQSISRMLGLSVGNHLHNLAAKSEEREESESQKEREAR